MSSSTSELAQGKSIEELSADAQSCKLCSLAATRTNVVFGEGNPKSPLVLVGEGPGAEEDKTGRPFVGRAGQLLDKALEEAGLDRTQVYICNTVKCRACVINGNRVSNRPPEPSEILACRRWLIPQLEAIGPQVILCIGAPSAKNLIKPDFKITKERGKYFPTELAKVAIAALHPAYILRNQGRESDGGFSLLVADIKRAWECAQKLKLQQEGSEGVE